MTTKENTENTKQNQDNTMDSIDTETNSSLNEKMHPDTETTEPQKELDLPEQITLLEEKCIAAEDKAMRAYAEAENVRRRARLDVEKAYKYANETTIDNLLPVIDSLEQAITTIDKNEQKLKPIFEGLQLTLKLFETALKKMNISVIDPKDEIFDPKEHEALTMQPSDEVPVNNILNVIQKGYKLADRIIRPAKVIVSKGK